jgi:hypothetical protein
MKRIVFKFDCPHCQRALEIRPNCQDRNEGFAFSLGHYQCPGCGAGLSLSGNQTGPESFIFQLTQPKTNWNLDDILAREG